MNRVGLIGVVGAAALLSQSGPPPAATESAWIGCGGSAISYASSTTYYGPWGGNIPAQTSETQALLACRTPGTLQNLYVLVSANSRTTDTVIMTRIAGSDGNLTITIPAGATGLFSDTSHTDTVEDGDLWGLKLVAGASAQSVTIVGVSAELVSLGQAKTPITTRTNVTITSTPPFNREFPWGGAPNLLATVAGGGGFAEAGIASHLQAINNAGAVTIRTRLNGSNGAQSVVGSGAGLYEDASNTDTVARGDGFSGIIETSGSGSNSVQQAGIVYDVGVANQSVTMSSLAGSLGNGQTRYNPVWGQGLQTAEVQTPAPVAGTLSRLTIRVLSNASSSDVIVVLRINGTDATQTITIPAGATGAFTDTTHTDLVSPGDLVSVKMSGANANVAIRNSSLLFEAGA